MKKIFITMLLAAGTFMLHAQIQQTAPVPVNDKIQIGQQAPDLEFSNPDGQTIKLSDINKHRLILLDFWASWCHPCRMANPGLVAMYKRYYQEKFKNAKKGFTIVSVSLDKTKDAWVKAIVHDSLNWPYHMSDLGSWNSKAAQLYGVEFIPQAFLIDETGKIIGKYEMGEQAEEDIKKQLKTHKKS
jgi:peroxiredoxin